MIAFKKPDFTIAHTAATEIKALDEHKILRKVPAKTSTKLLVATWNLANFGLQKRQATHFEMMAHIIQYFDVIAVQEIADDIRDLEKLMSILGGNYDCIYSDIGGNQERGAYIYDSTKVSRKGLVAELVIKSNREREIEIEVGEVVETKSFLITIGIHTWLIFRPRLLTSH